MSELHSHDRPVSPQRRPAGLPPADKYDVAFIEWPAALDQGARNHFSIGSRISWLRRVPWSFRLIRQEHPDRRKASTRFLKGFGFHVEARDTVPSTVLQSRRARLDAGQQAIAI